MRRRDCRSHDATRSILLCPPASLLPLLPLQPRATASGSVATRFFVFAIHACNNRLQKGRAPPPESFVLSAGVKDCRTAQEHYQSDRALHTLQYYYVHSDLTNPALAAEVAGPRPITHTTPAIRAPPPLAPRRPSQAEAYRSQFGSDGLKRRWPSAGHTARPCRALPRTTPCPRPDNNSFLVAVKAPLPRRSLLLSPSQGFLPFPSPVSW